MKTEWDLTLLYSGPDDQQIEKDAKAIERAFASFEEKYRTADFTQDEVSLHKALSDYEVLFKKTHGMKPLYYFHYRKELNAADENAIAKVRLLEERFTKAANRIQFFSLTLGKIDEKKQTEYLASRKLAKYRYFLHHTFLCARHDLSEPEEKILSLKSGPSSDMWVSGVSMAISNKEVVFKGKKMPINKALNEISGMSDVKDRRALHKAAMQSLKEVGDFAESEINAVFTDKKISDELRNYAEPYDSWILYNQNEASSVLTLVDTVTKHMHLGHRFYEAKRKLMKLPYLTYADRGASVGKERTKYPFPKSVSTVREVFSGLDPKYAELFDHFLETGHIDVLPRKGKTGGAYCSSGTESPTLVLLNHVGNVENTLTLAHEMGHAIHAEWSKKQPVLYQSHTYSTAETASTFFEGVALEHIMRDLPPSAQLVVLHDKIQRNYINTIFRQIACFNYELELHRTVREKGWISKKDIALLHNKHMSAYAGKAMRFEEDDGYFFVNWSHLRRPFYVYTYAYGMLISAAMREKYKEDPTFIKHVDAFLTAGGSMSPEDIFASIGLDVRSPELFETGLKAVERDIELFESLAKKHK